MGSSPSIPGIPKQPQQPTAAEAERLDKQKRAAALRDSSNETILGGRVLGRSSSLGGKTLPTLLGN